MRFVSTRGKAAPVTLEDAISAGLAPDGGLYMPEQLPKLSIKQFDDAYSPQDVSARLLAPFFAGSSLEGALLEICTAAMEPPLQLRALSTPHDHVLELFHGPTLAFKDFGARFLAEVLGRLRSPRAPPLTILVATSGDTGAAVAAAFHGLEGFRVVILYPRGRVSPRQAHLLGAYGDNVCALQVDGTFDDCQRMVKAALRDLSLRVSLSSANSISLGRLLPQMGYYAWAALKHQRRHAKPLSFVVPTGNLGNALACVLARKMGLPIGEIVLSTNANDVLPRFFAGEDYVPMPSISTLANAMDVGAPSNFERLRWLYGSDAKLRRELRAFSVDNAAIRSVVRASAASTSAPPCPHTATAVHVLAQLRSWGENRDYALVATSHAAKFAELIEPLVGHAVEMPPQLELLLSRRAASEPLSAQDAALQARLLKLAAS